jgi:tRNA pseudouridine(55) synthase
VPPIFSAIQKDGKRAYDMARAGEKVELASRKVLVESFKITHINMPYVGFEIVCSKGTYIRALARDFGKLFLPSSINNCPAIWVSLSSCFNLLHILNSGASIPKSPYFLFLLVE